MDVGFWMSYYFDNKLLPAISFIAELPFSKLKGKPPIADNLGFNIDPSGFQNLYYVPYDSNFLTDMDIPDAVSFLLLIAYIIDEKELEAKSLLDISGGKNVWEKYYSAYLDVKTEDYAAATALYNEIVAENLSSIRRSCSPTRFGQAAKAKNRRGNYWRYMLQRMTPIRKIFWRSIIWLL